MNCRNLLIVLMCNFLWIGSGMLNGISAQTATKSEIGQKFVTPPNNVRPGVYWYFMDGNLDGVQMTKDLESMKESGIGNLIFLEVNVGVPRGKVDFLSEEWQNLFAHAVKEAERLGIAITLGVGPGWTGSGGPWVEGKESMRHLVYSKTEVEGKNDLQSISLPKPMPRKPYFGEGVYTPELKQKALDYYEDVKVLAYPITPESNYTIEDVDKKALYYRDPYSSMPGVKPTLPITRKKEEVKGIMSSKVVDLTSFLEADGTLKWKVPAGKWAILRMGMRNNGGVTRPAPYPGLGFECDKFQKEAFQSHFDNFIGKLLKKTGTPDPNKEGGLKMFHMDSWEMGAQNWGDDFAEQFKRRRGYDPTKHLPIYAGQVVDTEEKSERFLFDLRITAQELVIENHAGKIKEIAHKNNMGLSIQPYDMNPASDIDLGAVADVPMCEFWNKGIGFNTSFGCIESTSIAHLLGKQVVGAEAFTSNWGGEGYISYPTVMKNQTDWAFATGINKLVFHTFAHKIYGDQVLPGMAMGGYGVHWDRGQTWWPMVTDYHTYISRCSYVLQQGRTIADILYLSAEGAPSVFLPPSSALDGDAVLPDRKGYNFDGCSPNLFMQHAQVSNGKIVFPGGASYKVLVLPNSETMTPQLLGKVEQLLKQGALVIGNRPLFSPSLTGYPGCDQQLQKLADNLWGKQDDTMPLNIKKYGNGYLISGKNIYNTGKDNLYPTYQFVSEMLQQFNLEPDFITDGAIRYTHRQTDELDIYFIANKSDGKITSTCNFRATSLQPELWNPLTGEQFVIAGQTTKDSRTELQIELEPYQSYFVVFDKKKTNKNLPEITFKKKEKVETIEINTPWSVSFDPKWGGPSQVKFDKLIDWSLSDNKGIKYYSGIAVYKNQFIISSEILQQQNLKIRLDVGDVKHMARVRINGKEAGILWTSPWNLEIRELLKPGENQVEIEVANLWVNRLIGDEFLPKDGIIDGKYPDWLLNKTPRTSGRYTFTVFDYYKKESSLVSSGLLGPVVVFVTK